MSKAFGGPWTLIKLDVLESYLRFYTTALKNQGFKLCYVDAFAGSGAMVLKTQEMIEGSALRSLKYPFDRYIYIEKDQVNLKLLQHHIASYNPDAPAEFLPGDCNDHLAYLMRYPWYRDGWRGVLFLDPYAMELRWSTLDLVAKSKAFDVWYLFPLSALLRCLAKDEQAIVARMRIDDLLGTRDWYDCLYVQPAQLSLFNDDRRERVELDTISSYIVNRLKQTFPGVADNPLVLRQPANNSPLFLLCFAASNPSVRAQQLSLKVANHILNNRP